MGPVFIQNTWQTLVTAADLLLSIKFYFHNAPNSYTAIQMSINQQNATAYLDYLKKKLGLQII